MSNLREVLKDVYERARKQTGLPKPKNINFFRMANGNSKLDSDIAIFDLLSGVSCGRHCAKCYAHKTEYLYKNTRFSRTVNTILAQSYVAELKEIIKMQLNVENPRIVRIHSAGDFLSQDYIDMWTEIVKEFPKMKFYTYSKRLAQFDFSGLKARKNINIINSLVTLDGKECFNYGDKNHVEKLVAKGYTVCPATIQAGIKCGVDCVECLSKKKICFAQH